jgi:hypothetical protein
MNWQDAVVFVIVGAAVWFLVRHVWPRQKPAETFVPTSSIKRRSEHEGENYH